MEPITLRGGHGDHVSPASAAPQKHIFGVGEMAELTRSLDWSRTSLGPIERWPETLLITVNTLLASRHPMFLWWGDDLVQFYNDAYRPSIGADKHPKALGQRGEDCWPEIWSIIAPQIGAVMTRGDATWMEDALIPIFRDGKLEDVYWTYSYSPVREVTGKVCGTLVTCSETTGRVLAERMLRASLQERSLLIKELQQERERLAGLFQQAPAFFAVLRGPEYIFEMINPLYQELIGQRSLIGKSIREAVPEAEEQGFLALLDRVYRTGEPFVGRGTRINLARSAAQPLEERYLDFVYQPTHEADGTISGIIVLGVDVTESKRIEQALIQAEKLAAVGRLASAIAHEINNPLESVTNLLYLAQKTAVNPETRQHLDTAERELRRASAITTQTLRFHKQSTSPRSVTCEDLIRSSLSIYQGRLFNSNVTVDKRKRARCPVLCFDGEIQQVLSNLFGNAIDAMPAGGRLLVRSRNGTNWKTGQKGLVITVADTGSGMSPHASKKAFEAFFTTKGLNGTGLGLWISREIMDRHKGKLTLRSSQRNGASGTVITVFLPFDAAVR